MGQVISQCQKAAYSVDFFTMNTYNKVKVNKRKRE